MWGIGRLFGAVVVCGVIGLAGWWYAIGWRPDAEAYPIQGVAVDSGTGRVDWAMARARDVDFGYALATRGDRGRDTMFETHWAAMAQAGVRRGAIHAYSLCRLAADQADHFNAVVPRMPDALPAVISFAFTNDCADRPPRDVLLREIGTMLERVERHTGVPVLIRITEDFEAEYRLSESVDRTLWAARNGFEPDYLSRPWRMWQANDARRVDGFERPVKWNVVAL